MFPFFFHQVQSTLKLLFPFHHGSAFSNKTGNQKKKNLKKKTFIFLETQHTGCGGELFQKNIFSRSGDH